MHTNKKTLSERQGRVKRPHWDKHVSNDFLPFKEETNNKCVNPGQLLHGMQCTRCKRNFVKTAKSKIYNKDTQCVFNSRKPVMCCEVLLTEGPRVCSFLHVMIAKED